MGRRPGPHPDTRAKAAEMAAMYRSGMTMQQVADQFDCSRQAVQQLLRHYHAMSGADGGAAARIANAKLGRQIARDAQCVARWGCVHARLVELRRLGAVKAYGTQRQNAEHRGIGWELTLWQWWSIWLESGRWDQRGRKRGQYVMCRKGDVGPYAIDNVFIGLASDNCREGITRYWTERRAVHSELPEAA